MPVRQWVLSFPIPLRSLFAIHPDLLTAVLRIIHRTINSHLIQQTQIKRNEAATGAITLIQRFGSAANLNTHLHALVLDGVYHITAAGPVFIETAAPSHAQLQTLLGKIIHRIMKYLTQQGHLIEEDGITYLARTDDINVSDPDNVLAPLQAASSTWRIAQGPRAGRKVLTLVGCGERSQPHQSRDALCANAQGFSLHAGVHCDACDRKGPSTGSGQASNNCAATSPARRSQTNA